MILGLGVEIFSFMSTLFVWFDFIGTSTIVGYLMPNYILNNSVKRKYNFKVKNSFV